MADYSSPTPISLSQPHHGGAGDLSPNSDNDSSDHATPQPRPTTSSKSLRRPISSSSPPPSSDHGSKKPRGRPPGSKNKPKPPLVITKEVADGGMKPVVLEISAGSDVVDSVVKYATRRRVGLTLLSGSGSVSNVTLRHPLSHAPAMISLHGPFSVLSLSGSVVGPETSSTGAKLSFGICLAGAQGQVFGGIVGGKVVAASTVVVVAATFVTPSFHRIPGDGAHDQDADHHEESKPSVGGGGAEVGSTSGSMTAYSGGGGGGGSGGVASPTPINCQLASPDHHHHQQQHHHVMPGWAHNSRSPY